MNNIKILIDRDRLFGDTFSVRMAKKNERGWAIAKPNEWFVTDEIGIEPLPAITLTKNDAQAFMDELWNVGFRPTEGSGSAGAMAAVQAHLEDMRKLVFTEGERKP